MSITSVHPFADAFPMMTREEMERLVADVKEHGQIEPCIVNSRGVLLDGRNRRAACEQLGIEPRIKYVNPDSETAYILSLNVARRHLNDSQLGVVGYKALPFFEAEARERQRTLNNRVLVADRPQARAPLARDLAAAAVGTSGRMVARAKRVSERAPELLPAVEAGNLTLNAAEATIRQREREHTPAAPDASIPDSHDGRIGLWHGDFRERLLQLEAGSVDLIVTDPPYPKDDLPLYSDLAQVAAKILGPRGILFVWTGQIFLPEVIARLSEHLTYGWTFALHLPGSGSRIMGRHIIQAWKPVLAFTTGTWPSGSWGDDWLVSPGRDKAEYEWQQNAAPARRLIERYSAPDGLVVDPFLGVGSFGVAAKEAGRRFVGVELDAGRFNKARERLT